MNLTKREAAARLRCHPDTVGRLIKSGRLEASKNDGRNGRVLIPEESVEKYLMSRRVKASS